nr:non-ribosomal peptide synthetase [Methylosinus trichosporium]
MCWTSYAQLRQWFLWRLAPSSTAYHISGALRLEGVLDVSALWASFAALVERHESLRTVFRADAEGRVEQHILAAMPIEAPLIDLGEVAEAEREGRMRERAQAICDLPFDLTQGPLLRVAVIRTGEKEHVLVVVMHHIVSDGWSMQIIVEEFVAQYRARLRGEAAALEPLPIQYADYAAWQRNWLEAGEKERQLSYWRGQLGAEHPVLQLPTDHPRKAEGSYRAGRYAVEAPARLIAALQRRAQAEEATLFMALLAGLQALLHRYAGESDIRVGVPIANRHRAETEGVVGFFVNTQVLRNVVEPRRSFSHLLRRTREAALGAQAHQDLPFEQLVEALQPDRNLGTNPLFQVMFNHQRQDRRALQDLPGLRLTELSLGDQGAQFELAVDSVEDSDGRLMVTFSYARELFDAATIERMAGHYMALLEALAERPDQAVGDVDLLGAAERGRLLEWGANDRRFSDVEPVHRLFERQARSHPEAVAVTFEGASLTYGELNARANRLAHRLIALGVKPDGLVGVAVERSLEMVVSLLAVLKAGGAYVPLDPDYPADRLAYMAQDSGIALLLTQARVKERLSFAAGLTTLELDRLDVDDQSDLDPSVAVHAESLAYVIYTSGSTGWPKGVAIRHRSLASCMMWMQDAYGLAGADAVLHKAPFGFDVSVWEIFWPLTSGARLVVANPGDHRDPERIVELIRRHEITTLNFVPAMLQAFLAHEGVEERTRLRHVICGGEAMPAATQREALQRLHGASLENLYGPTETTIHVTQWRCRDDGRSRVPIGRPIAETQAHVLDEGLAPTPVGVSGELYIGGELLARGYLHRAGLSAERFIADPFDDRGGRLYRTGDLARWSSEGELEYLGRLDDQVKVRGFRVELGEIEAQLLAQSEVREAAVVAQAGPGGSRLVGYVSAASGRTIDPSALRARLRERLPDHMTPSAIVVLESLPLNANGKIDRKALPAAEFVSDRGYEAPQGEVEEALAAIWAETLGVERIGRNDNFFELGGDSILSLQIVARLHRAGWKISPRQMFERQTIAEMAPWAENASENEEYPTRRRPNVPLLELSRAEIETLAIPVESIEDILPLTPMQQGMLLHTLLDPESGMYLMQDRFNIHSALDIDALWRSWDVAFQEHAALRAGFVWQGMETPCQIIHRNVTLPKERLDLRHLERSEAVAHIEQILEKELATGFDMSKAPLIRLRLAQISDHEFHLVLSFHHMLMDAWCSGLLMGEVLSAYDRLTEAGEPPPSPAPSIPYRDFLAWLMRQDRDAAIRYWREKLAGFNQVTRLPINRRGPAGAAGSRMVNVRTALSAEQTQRLHTVSKHERITPNTLVQGAWALVLAYYSGLREVLFGVTVAGRPAELPELHRTIGLFINTIPLRVRLPDPGSATSVAEWLRSLLSQNLEARDFAYLPLVEVHGLTGMSHDQSLFDSLFVFENAPVDVSLIARAKQWSVHDASSRTHTNYPITVVVVPEDELLLQITYDERFFDAAVAEQLMRSFRHIVERLIGAPAAPLDAVGALADSERLSLIASGRGPDRAHPFELGFVGLFERQAAIHGGRVAARCGGRSITYESLDASTNRIAWLLLDANVIPGRTALVFAERGIGFLEIVVGCFKAGAAYLAVDVDTPVQRLAQIVASSDAQVIVVGPGCAALLGPVLSLLPAPFVAPRIIDSSLAESMSHARLPVVPVHPDLPAYVIFTSGSTGEPKGAVVTSRGMLNNQLSKIDLFALGCDDVIAQTALQSFDISVWQLLCGLLCGACVEIVPTIVTRDPVALLDLLEERGVTVFECVPSMMQALMEGAPLSLPKLRVTLVTGEAAKLSHVQVWRDRYRHTTLVNAYGPAECADDVALHVKLPGEALDATDSWTEGTFPIGRAVDNIRLCVLDDNLDPAPAGVPGELYVAGIGVGQGYLQRPELTAERFVADLFSGVDGARMYRTGDIVRRGFDGVLHYLGRSDSQVKIRGHRIELGEVEALLVQHGDVQDAVVTVCAEAVQGQRLVAYVVPAPSSDDVEEDLFGKLRAYMEQRLPDYMAPTIWMRLDALPTTANGKVDRRALPRPEFSSHCRSFRAPATETQRCLADIWRQVLNVDRVGLDDNFFELGGHSLSAMQVIARIQNTLRQDIPINILISSPTLERFSSSVDERGGRVSDHTLEHLDSFLSALENS